MTFVFNPVRDFVRSTEELQREMEKLFTGTTDARRPEVNWVPAVEITETDSAYFLEADLPGLSKEDVKLSIENNTLTLSGERKQKPINGSKFYHHNERAYGAFRRTFNLSQVINNGAIEAVYEQGVLKLTLPKAEEAKPHNIEIKVS